MRNKGFTLIELLVVIAIIALLMSILMPALARVRQQANTIVCQATLGQWGLAVSMYTDDHDGKFWKVENLSGVNYNHWWNFMFPYIKSEEAFLCTEATKTDAEGAQQPCVASQIKVAELGRNIKSSYAMSQYVYHPGDDAPPERMEKFWCTSNVRGGDNIPIVMGSARMTTLSPFYSATTADEPPEYEGDVMLGDGAVGEVKRVCVNRHRGYVNMTFMDFSTRKVGLKELWTLKWHRTLDYTAFDPPVWPNWMRQFSDVK